MKKRIVSVALVFTLILSTSSALRQLGRVFHDFKIWQVIDGNLLEEPYAFYSDISYDDFKVKVPKDTYFVMGDNRLQSSDSRTFGVVPMENIFGVVIKIKK